MRFITAIALLITGLSCNAPKNAASNMKSNKLNGTWMPIKQEIGGKPLPAAVFEKEKLTITDTIYTVAAESIDRGVLHHKDDKMDIYGKEGVNAGKHFTAIYKFDNEQLVICYDLTGNNYPEAFDTKGKPMYFLSVFKKEQTK